MQYFIENALVFGTAAIIHHHDGGKSRPGERGDRFNKYLRWFECRNEQGGRDGGESGQESILAALSSALL
jgi:hypothetical protein